MGVVGLAWNDLIRCFGAHNAMHTVHYLRIRRVTACGSAHGLVAEEVTRKIDRVSVDDVRPHHAECRSRLRHNGRS